MLKPPRFHGRRRNPEDGTLSDRKPLICVLANQIETRPGRFRVHASATGCIDSVERFAECVPIILPGLAGRIDPECFAGRIDGLLLTGGRANVEPHHYGGKPFPDDEIIDPARDHTGLPLIRACIGAGVPVFGICRGIQELNVALGGTLHYRVHQVPGLDDHRMPQRDDLTMEEVFRLRHPVRLTRGGYFERLAGVPEVMVNSLHGQGIERLAPRLSVEARSPDGLIEGVRLREAPGFTVGVQWHAEWRPEEHALSRALFREFGRAARAGVQRRRASAPEARAAGL